LTNLEKVPRELLHFVCILCDWKKKRRLSIMLLMVSGHIPIMSYIKKSVKSLSALGLGIYIEYFEIL